MRRAISLVISISAAVCPLSVGRCADAPIVPVGGLIAPVVPNAIADRASALLSVSTPLLPIGQAADGRPSTTALRADSAARSYLGARSQHYFLGTLYELLLLFDLLVIGIGARYWNGLGRVSARPWARALLYVPAVLGSIAVLSFPLDAWNHALALEFDHSHIRWPVWIESWALSRGLDLAVVSVAFLVLYPIIRRRPRMWWVAAWGALVVVTGLAGGVARIVGFNTATRLMVPLSYRYPEVVADMERVARNAGDSIAPNHLVEWPAAGSPVRNGIAPEFAAASPTGVSERILFAEPLIKRTSRPEILFVFGHEMGHLVLHHSIKSSIVDAMILLLLVYVGFRAVSWMLTRWGLQWGIANVADYASLPLLLFLLAILNFVKIPAFNLTSRYFEHEADRYGLEAIHGIVPSPAAAAAGLFQLCLENCGADADLGGFAGFWFRDHPTDDERTRFAITYNPWSEGQHPRYVLPRVTDANSGEKQTPAASP